MQKKFNVLTPEEERVILHKGTEAPFSGEYDAFFREGTLPVPALRDAVVHFRQQVQLRVWLAEL